MSVSVAEYFGQRVDVDYPTIKPIDLSNKSQTKKELEQGLYRCPFSNGNACKKIKSGNAPVCSVRNSNGILWINCSERLCSSVKDLPLSNHQAEILHEVGKTIFNPDITKEDILVKREVPLSVDESTKYSADFIITTREGNHKNPGPDRLVLEMQGGGETSNTGAVSRHIKSWMAMETPTNEFLRSPVNANPLETNAWRRQQEQFLVKGNIALMTWKGYGIAFCVGDLLFEYLKNKLSTATLPDLKDYNWTLSLICFCEDTSKPKVPGPIPLKIDKDRVLYTNYLTFVQALINQGKPSLDAFRGLFSNLENIDYHVD